MAAQEQARKDAAEKAAAAMTQAQEQAVRQAESYLNLKAFSRKGLIEQLEHDGFTAAQAAFGSSCRALTDERDGHAPHWLRAATTPPFDTNLVPWRHGDDLATVGRGREGLGPAR